MSRLEAAHENDIELEGVCFDVFLLYLAHFPYLILFSFVINILGKMHNMFSESMTCHLDTSITGLLSQLDACLQLA